MIEYTAVIYKTNRNKTYMANCIVKNRVGFGKTEEDAINNLKESLYSLSTVQDEINITPVHDSLIAQ